MLASTGLMQLGGDSCPAVVDLSAKIVRQFLRASSSGIVDRCTGVGVVIVVGDECCVVQYLVENLAGGEFVSHLVEHGEGIERKCLQRLADRVVELADELSEIGRQCNVVLHRRVRPRYGRRLRRWLRTR